MKDYAYFYGVTNVDEKDKEKERLVEAIQNGDAEMEGFAIAEAPGRAFIEFIKDVESKCKELKTKDKQTQDSMNSVMAMAIEIGHAMFTLHYYSLPFYHMHKQQSFSEKLFDEEAKKLAALVAADLTTIRTVSQEATETMERLRKHMDPVFKRLKAEEARKESLDTGVAADSTQTNIIDFEERRGQKRKETLH